MPAFRTCTAPPHSLLAPPLSSKQVNNSLAAEREAKRAAEKDKALVQIVLEAKQRLADAMREEAAAAAKALAAERAITADTAELQAKLVEVRECCACCAARPVCQALPASCCAATCARLFSPPPRNSPFTPHRPPLPLPPKKQQLNNALAFEREARAAVESEKRLVHIELEAKQRRLGELASQAMGHAEVAAAVRAECDVRYNELLDTLNAERQQRAALEKQVDDASVQLAAANNRYQDALMQLHAERARAVSLEVRSALCLRTVPCPALAAALRPAASSSPFLLSSALVPPSPRLPRPQREAKEARELLSAANSRYSELSARYDDERAKADALEVRGESWRRAGERGEQRWPVMSCLELRRTFRPPKTEHSPSLSPPLSNNSARKSTPARRAARRLPASTPSSPSWPRRSGPRRASTGRPPRRGACWPTPRRGTPRCTSGRRPRGATPTSWG